MQLLEHQPYANCTLLTQNVYETVCDPLWLVREINHTYKSMNRSHSALYVTQQMDQCHKPKEALRPDECGLRACANSTGATNNEASMRK